MEERFISPAGMKYNILIILFDSDHEAVMGNWDSFL